MAKSGSKFYLRQWRKHRGYTLERLAEMVEMSVGYLSDLEKGKRRYNQDFLELVADALRCEPADLIMRDPSDPQGLWSIYEALSPVQREQLTAIGETLKKTG